MTELTGGLRGPLASPRLYSAIQRALGAEHARRVFTAEYLRPVAGERLLDLGCGPGDILAQLPAVEYLGVDRSPGYIDAARSRHGARASFRQADLRGLRLEDGEVFDTVMSIGVLHHLDDAGARGMIALAARVLTPSGRLVTMDPALDKDQSRVARWLIGRDRGRRVRSVAAYHALADGHFQAVSATVRHDLARIPYTHVIMECRGPITGART
jgi:SAM-dependent methyltransferase